MRFFRMLFLPEFGRSFDQARGGAFRISGYLEVLKGPGGPVVPGRLLLPAGRAAALAGCLLAGIGASLAVEGFTGLGEAAAQTVDPGLFASEDSGTRKILSFLSDFGSTGSPVLGQMLGVFNGGVLMLAGFLLVWHTVSGSVDTAREGRWGFGGWEILRIVIAVALMAPIPGAGASGAQYIVVSLARLGGDFANLVWEPLAVETLGKGRAVVPWPREREWRTVLGRTLVSEVCMYVANAEARAAGEPDYIAVRTEVERKRPSTVLGRIGSAVSGAVGGSGRPVSGEVVHYDGVGRGMPKDLCGAVRFGGLDEDGGRGIAAHGHKAAWRAAAPAVMGVAKELGDRYVRGSGSYGEPLPDVGAALDGVGVADSYRAILELRMKQAGEEEEKRLQEKVVEDAEKTSWLAAASFVNTLSESAARIQAAAANVPMASVPSRELETWAKDAHAAVEAVILSLGQGGGYEPVQISLGGGIAGTRAPSAGRGGDIFDRVLKFIDPSSVIVADSGNPLRDLASTGFLLMNGAIGAILSLAGVSVVSNTVGIIPAFDVFEGAWEVADGFVTPLLAILLIAGAVLGYVLPVIPFIRFLFGILAWLLAIVEAMLAVTVFCAAHVRRGEGDRLVLSDTRQGWLFLPGLVLRPALMLFGLVIGYFVFVTIMDMFNEIWVPRMTDATGSEGLGLVDFVAMLALYVMIAYGLVNAAFKLIDVLPNAVLAWIGGQGTGETGSEGVTGMAVGGFGRAGGFRGPARFGATRRGVALRGRSATAPPGGD